MSEAAMQEMYHPRTADLPPPESLPPVRVAKPARESAAVRQRRRSRAIRRGRLRGYPRMTAAEWVRVLYIFDGRCAYCGRLPDARTGELLTKDCMVPVARNGLYLAFNVVPACRYCNTSKANRNVVDWMLSKGRERQLDLLIERMDELWRAYLTW